MKRTILIFLTVITLLFTFTLFPSAESEFSDNAFVMEEENGENEAPTAVFVPSTKDITEKVEVIKNGSVAEMFDIITNNKTYNARDTIQKAIRYAKNNNGENAVYTVRLPKGSYYFYSSLDIYSNITLDLNGSTIYRVGSCASLIRFGEKNDISYGYDGYKNITIENGTFDGNLTGHTSLIRFAHAENVNISNLTFTNTSDVMHQLTFAACNNVNITDCTFKNMHISEKLEGYNCEAVQIDILKKGHFDYPAYDGTATRNVTVTGCTFENVQRGIGTHSAFANHYFDSITITNNTFRNIQGYAINAINYINSVISGNTITDCSSGINCSTVTNEKLLNYYAPLTETDTPINNLNVEISNNNIDLSDNDYDHVAYGVNILGMEIRNYKDSDGKKVTGDYRLNGVTVKNNSITSKVSNHNFYAIQVQGAISPGKDDLSNVILTDNKITISCDDPAIKANYGIRVLDSKNVNLKNNEISDNGDVPHLECGVRVENSSGCIVESTKITNTTSFGLKLTACTDTAVNSNIFKQINSDGIYIFSKCSSVSLENNVLHSPKGHGIYVRDSKFNTINKNRILSPGGNGIYITGTSAVKNIIYNDVIDVQDHGIYLNKDATATNISNNNIDITDRNSIAVYLINNTSVNSIDNNRINTKTCTESANLEPVCTTGITINSKKCDLTSVKNNTIKECMDSAIILHSLKSTAAAIDGNNLFVKKGMGIYVSNSVKLSSVSSNYVCGATDHGIYLNKNAVAPNINNNTVDITNKECSGIYLIGSASATNIDNNSVNTKSNEESKNLNVACKSGITVNSKKCSLKSIKGNTVKKPVSSGITLHNLKLDAKPKIDGNTLLIKKGNGIYISNSAAVSDITDNYVSGSTDHGIYLNKNASAVNITGNTIDVVNSEMIGIYILNSATVTAIEDNIINAKTNSESADLAVSCKSGILINSNNCAVKSISRNTVKESLYGAVVIHSVKADTKPAIKENTLIINKGMGIYISNSAAVSNVNSNYICGATDHGIYLNKNAVASTIKGNVIDVTSKKAVGIYLINNTSVANIESNKINTGKNEESASLKLAIESGIKINSKKCKLKTIKKNYINKPSDTGIVLHCINSKSTPSITSNTVIKGKMGIYVSNNVTCSDIKSNFISGTKSHGIYLNNNAVAGSISKNTVDVIGKDANGIYLIGESSVKTINDNTINAKKKSESKKLKVKCTYGIGINSKACEITEIKGNTVKGASNTAICIYNSKTKPSITDNTVEGSPYGIRYKKAKLKNNTFIDCSKKSKKL